MNLDRQLARLMAVVIVMIAAYVWPSAAEAHEGHVHPQHSAVVSYTPAASPAVPAAIAETVSAAAVKAEPAVLAAVAAKAGAQTPAERPCNGVCCSMGMSCCAPALIPDVSPVSVPEMSGVRPIAPETRAFASITLEALPKPPKSFA